MDVNQREKSSEVFYDNYQANNYNHETYWFVFILKILKVDNETVLLKTCNNLKRDRVSCYAVSNYQVDKYMYIAKKYGKLYY